MAENKVIQILLFIKHTGNKKGRKETLTQYFNKIFHYIKRAEEVKTKIHVEYKMRIKCVKEKTL